MASVDASRVLVEVARGGKVAQAWHQLAVQADALASNRELALAFAELLSLDPQSASAVPYAEKVLTGFGQDPEVVIALSAALIRVAEQRPADEPPFTQGPAHLAAGACQRCFESLPSQARTDPAIGGYLQLNQADGLRMMGPDHDEDALKAYQLALAIDGSRGAWWFHLGLLHKWRGRFKEGLEANQQAYAKLGPTRPVLWNLALCATALGQGERAQWAWRQLGIAAELTASGMPFVSGMPPMQVRVATMGEEVGMNDPLPNQAVTFEVLWFQPLSPCHGVVQSPTARRASVDYGDLILYDGAPVHVHEVQGKPVPIFPLLWVLRPGRERRLRFVAMQNRAGLLEALGEGLGQGVQLVAFDRRTQSGQPSELVYGKILVDPDVPLAELQRALEQGIRAQPGLTLAVPALHEKLGDTPQAGKAHQAWGGIERAAERAGLLVRRGS